jgi:UDPglucose 6-dehydrogenase
MRKRVTVMGTGYEGLTIATGLATLGHEVTSVDSDCSRSRRLQRGNVSDVELELSKRLKKVVREGRLNFTSEPESALAASDAVFLASLPSRGRKAERAAVAKAAECITGSMEGYTVILVTAAVPIGTSRLLQDWLDEALPSGSVDVVSSPVFLNKGRGLKDFHEPDRLVLGYEKEKARRTVDEIYALLLMEDVPVFHVSWEAAEMMRSPDTGPGAAVAVNLPRAERKPLKETGGGPTVPLTAYRVPGDK